MSAWEQGINSANAMEIVRLQGENETAEAKVAVVIKVM